MRAEGILDNNIPNVLLGSKRQNKIRKYMCNLQFKTYWLSYVPMGYNLLICDAPYSGVNTPSFQRNLLSLSSQMITNTFFYFLCLFFVLQTVHFQKTRIHTLISVTVCPRYLCSLWFSDLMEIHYTCRYNVVGIATHYGLDCPEIESRKRHDIPHPSRLALGPIASCKMNYRVCFSGIKLPGRGVDHSHTASADVKERVELYLYSPSRSSWTVPGWTYSYEIILCLILAFCPLTLPD
jgi:hypothetical protein